MKTRDVNHLHTSRFDFVKMLGHVQKYRISDLTMVPPVAVALAKHPSVKSFDLSSVQFIGSGAAPLGREVCVEVEKLWPKSKVNLKQVSFLISSLGMLFVCGC